MNRPTIGLIGPRFDDEMQVLIRALRERDAGVRVVDLTGLPGAHRLEIADDTVSYDGQSLAEVRAFYLRLARMPLDEDTLFKPMEARAGEPGLLQDVLRRVDQEREVNALVTSALTLLPAPLVNPLQAQFVHSRKVHHLRVLAAARVPVPPFLASNDPAALHSFLDAHAASGICVKPLRGWLKTQLYHPGQLPDLSRRPVLLQQYIPGVTVRVYAVGGRAVTAGEMPNRGHVDSSVDPLAPRRTELSAEENAVVQRASRAAHLPFTGLDLQRPRDGGQSLVLECNAAPMFANFCRHTGADVAGSLADYLIARARGQDAWIDGPERSIEEIK